MSVKHRARATFLYDSDVQGALVRRFSVMAANDSRMLIYHQDLLSGKVTFVYTAWTHGQRQGLALDHSAKVPTCAKCPAANLKDSGERGNAAGNLNKPVGHRKKDASKPASRASSGIRVEQRIKILVGSNSACAQEQHPFAAAKYAGHTASHQRCQRSCQQRA